MNLISMVRQEMRSRFWSVLSSSLALLLGVAAFVAIRHITVYSEQQVSQQLKDLGSNILILPSNASLQDYYAADKNGETISEELVSEIYLAGLSGVEQVSPRLNTAANMEGLDITLTGILPQAELAAQNSWQTTAIFTAPQKHIGCKKAKLSSESLNQPDSLIKNRAIHDLKPDELILGAEIANQSAFGVNDKVKIKDTEFRIIGVLPMTGTVDDTRVFAHLHTVQEIFNTGAVCNVIEVVGCCKDAAGDLVPNLKKLLPTTKVLTISQVVQTQVGVNRLMANTSWFVIGVLVLAGATSIAGATATNVRERRKEIGTLMALGATPSFVLRLFLTKYLILGICAGTLGAIIGMATAVIAGPNWAGVSVSPLPVTAILSVVFATLLSLISSWLPAKQAASLDPCACFQEI